MKSYFKLDEFKCKCCGENLTSQALIDMLNKARELAGVPFIITSGYRCKTHNKKVGGKDNSAHLRGLAADISTKDSSVRHKILMAVYAAGFRRVGINKTFIHVDIDESLPQDVTFDY